MTTTKELEKDWLMNIPNGAYAWGIVPERNILPIRSKVVCVLEVEERNPLYQELRTYYYQGSISEHGCLITHISGNERYVRIRINRFISDPNRLDFETLSDRLIHIGTEFEYEHLLSKKIIKTLNYHNINNLKLIIDNIRFFHPYRFLNVNKGTFEIIFKRFYGSD